MKKCNFEVNGKKYEMYYDCPDKEINDQINEIFSDQDYELAKRKSFDSTQDRKDMVVLDVGANVGMFSLFIKPYARKIYAVEPSRRCFECLKENTKDWDNIEIFNVGFANRKDKAMLFGKGDQTPQTMMLEGENKEVINVTTIEDFMNENKIDHVDVMKIDTEGAEYIIFADQSFRNVADKIDFIIGESHFLESMIPEHVLIMLERAGFKAKLLPIENYVLYLNYDNTWTGQKEKFEVRKPSLFIGERK